MSVEKTVLTPPVVAVAAGTPVVAVSPVLAPAASGIAIPDAGVAARFSTGIRGSATNLRAWLLTAMLFLVPLLAYWPTTFHDYGLRDDYSNLRESHEEPGKVLAFCASHARPLYGLLLQATYGQTSSVQNLQWMRFGSVLLLGALCLVSFRSLRSFGWSFDASLCFALLVGLVPSAQVIAGWAIGWPYAVTTLIAIGGFFAAEGALAAPAWSQRWAVQWAAALGLMVSAALIYQPSALFYVVPLAAALIVDRERNAVASVRHAALHLGFVILALGVAYAIMSGLYAAGIFVKSGRIAFEQHWAAKLVWFLNEPLPNALNPFVLNDNNFHDHGLYIGGAALAGLLLVSGAVLEWRRYGYARGLVWVAALTGLPLFACMVSLVASEHYATYRTIFAMTAVLLLFLVASVSRLTESVTAGTRKLVALCVLAVAFVTANHHAYALLAVPQGNEWQLILQGAKQVRLPDRAGQSRPRVFAITSTPADISTATIYHDEFGSLSSNSEWVPREMFKRAIHDLHSAVPNLDSRYEFLSGARLPPGQRFDVIIDLHHLHRYYTDN
jgi:hypothetical protein